MPNEDKDFMKSRLKDSAFTSFRLHNYNSEINLTKYEQLASNNLNINKNIVIQNLTKTTVLFFLTKINILNECPKY